MMSKTVKPYRETAYIHKEQLKNPKEVLFECFII